MLDDAMDLLGGVVDGDANMNAFDFNDDNMGLAMGAEGVDQLGNIDMNFWRQPTLKWWIREYNLWLSLE